jgi:hypothetical protein
LNAAEQLENEIALLTLSGYTRDEALRILLEKKRKNKVSLFQLNQTS